MKLKLDTTLPSAETNFANIQLFLNLDVNQVQDIKSLLSSLVKRLLEKQPIDVNILNSINSTDIYSNYFTIVNKTTASGGMPVGYPGARFDHVISIHADLVLLFREITAADSLFYDPGYQLLAEYILKPA